MKEKVCWTMDGRKKVFLVDEDNVIVRELRDDGPLSEVELEWVKSNSGLPFKEWLERREEKEEPEEGEDAGPTA